MVAEMMVVVVVAMVSAQRVDMAPAVAVADDALGSETRVVSALRHQVSIWMGNTLGIVSVRIGSLARDARGMVLVGGADAVKEVVDIGLWWGYCGRRRCLVLGDCHMWIVADGRRDRKEVAVVVEAVGLHRRRRRHLQRKPDSGDHWAGAAVSEMEEH